MAKSRKAKHILTLIFSTIWMVIASVLWGVGLSMFLKDKGVGTWFMWGGICCISIIIPVIQVIVGSAKQGARDGANDYSVTDHGSHYTVENHPIRGAIFGLIGGLLGCILAGPVVVPIYMIKNIIDIIKAIVGLVKNK